MDDPSPGTRRMWELTRAFPEQLREGGRSGREVARSLPAFGGIHLFGMGGSGIAGEYLAQLGSAQGSHPVHSSREASLPKWLAPDTLVVVLSYSGDTWEALHVYREAGKRGLPRALVSAGGELTRLGRSQGVPLVRIPGGRPPRASLGLLFGGLAGLLPALLPPGEEMEKVAGSLESRSGELFAEDGPAAGLARRASGKELWTYAPEPLAPVGRRWKDDLEENAKELSHFDTIPELLHNAIVAWDTLPSGKSPKQLVTLLEAADSPPETRWEVAYLERELRKRSVPVERVRPAFPGLLAGLLELSWFGDVVSLFRAREKGVDPILMEGIVKMKAARKASLGERTPIT